MSVNSTGTERNWLVIGFSILVGLAIVAVLGLFAWRFLTGNASASEGLPTAIAEGTATIEAYGTPTPTVPPTTIASEGTPVVEKETATPEPLAVSAPGVITTGNELVDAALTLWPKTEAEAKVFFDAGACPTDEECRALENWETQVVTDELGISAIYVRREGYGEDDWHNIVPFPCRNPMTWPLYGQLGRPAERAVLGLTRAECVQMGIDPDWDGGMIPALYGTSGTGLCNGFSAYRPEPGSKWLKIAAWTVEERKPTPSPVAVQPWASEAWVRTRFSLGVDSVVEHIKGKSWRVKPASGHSEFQITNLDNCWKDGWRSSPGDPRPGVADETKAKRQGVPPGWTGQVQGATLWPCD